MWRILVECKPDYILLKQLGFSRYVIHISGKSKLLKMFVRKFKDNTIGVVDEDPGKPLPRAFIQELSSKYRLVIDECSIKVYRHIQYRKYIIELNEYLEDWLIKACRASKINPRTLGLPDNPIELHRIINIRLSKYIALLHKLKETNNTYIETLKKIIESIIYKQY